MLLAGPPDDELVRGVRDVRDDGEPAHANVRAVELRDDGISAEGSAVEEWEDGVTVLVVLVGVEAGQFEDGREDVNELRGDGNVLRLVASSRIVDDHGDARGGVVGRHLVELLVFHLHVAVIARDDEDGGAEEGVEVHANHGVVLGDHGVVLGSDLASAVDGVEGGGVSVVRGAALAHGRLEVAGMELVQGPPGRDADLGAVDLVVPLLARGVGGMDDLVPAVQKPRRRGREAPRDGSLRHVPVNLMGGAGGLHRAVGGAPPRLRVPAARGVDVIAKVDVLCPGVEPNRLGVAAADPVGFARDEDVVAVGVEQLVQPRREIQREAFVVVPGPDDGEGAHGRDVRQLVRVASTPERRPTRAAHRRVRVVPQERRPVLLETTKIRQWNHVLLVSGRPGPTVRRLHHEEHHVWTLLLPSRPTTLNSPGRTPRLVVHLASRHAIE
mmetsp:Transcript_23423/g.73338  ORF Transcript_23423/g.73338 Transcript_23423/m.73338 type:complete len:441 (-) Transcript_23423:414-1736(-)